MKIFGKKKSKLFLKWGGGGGGGGGEGRGGVKGGGGPKGIVHFVCEGQECFYQINPHF